MAGNSKKVVQLAELAAETIAITELEPNYGQFAGKQIKPNGQLQEYPDVRWWKQSVTIVPATVSHLFAYFRSARERNICLIRGAPANLERQPTLRQLAHQTKRGKDRGDHGFLDEPTKLFCLDVDGVAVSWRKNPEKAIRTVLGLLGERWASTSFVWFYTAGHGLERDNNKRWTGKIIDGKLRARIAFITERALNDSEASALTKICKAKVPEICLSLHTVQPNYIRRPLWLKHPDRDPLGNIATIGKFEGAFDYLSVPEDLTTRARWSKAQGHHSDIADHPDAETAVRAAGSGDSIRDHLKSAVLHLVNANPISEVTSFSDHAIAIVDQLMQMLERHREEIVANLAPFKRGWADVLHYVPDNMIDWAVWLLEHPSALTRKTIKLTKEDAPQEKTDGVTLESIYERVARAINRAREAASIWVTIRATHGLEEIYNNEMKAIPAEQREPYLRAELGELIAAPTGSRKSTLMRAAAVRFVAEHPDKSVVIAMPRHRLGDEQIELLQKEHPDGNYRAAVWRGRQAWDPEIGNGKEVQMCQRADEARELELSMLSVDSNLCKKGRGKKQVRCPLFDVCGYQRQKQIEANLWFVAHECMVHEQPKVFGEIGWLLIDELPLDAFMFGIDELVELPLDNLRTWPEWLDEDYDAQFLFDECNELYQALDRLKVSSDRHRGVPVAVRDLSTWEIRRKIGLEYKAKVEPDIRPTMSKRQVRAQLKKAAGNTVVDKRVTLWRQVNTGRYWAKTELYGGIKVLRGEKGDRVIRMVGKKHLAEGWRFVPTLVCDATGDVDLLRAIWSDLTAEPWPQLPRPNNVRIFQIVDRSIGKWAIAVEGKDKDKLEAKQKAARKMYAALLVRALAYGGRPVAAITYKSTEEWIRENCFLPSWLTLAHFGDVAGTNEFGEVAALFEIGRPLPQAEAVAQQAEALFADHVAERDFKIKKGSIPIVPDAAGHNTIKVDVWKHSHSIVEKLRWQVCEGSLIQAEGRARSGLRGELKIALDIHRWTDVPLPELGPVIAQLWDEVAVGLDGVMLAAEGVWLRAYADAERAYPDLMTAKALQKERERHGEDFERLLDKAVNMGICRSFHYRRAGSGTSATYAVFMADVTDPRKWLEARLGPLARFEPRLATIPIRDSYRECRQPPPTPRAGKASGRKGS